MARGWHMLITPHDPIGLLRNAQHVRFTLQKYLEHILTCDYGGTIVKDLSFWDTRSLCAMLTSHPTANAVIQCTGEVARNLINLLQACIDNGHISAGSKQRLVRTLIKLSKASQMVPRALLLNDVYFHTEPFAYGGFGDVHRGVWNEQEVAVKIVKVKKLKTIQQLAAEAAHEAVTHRHLEHLNITPFYGVFYEDNSQAVCLVSALMRSNLQDFLHAKGDYVDCIRLALDVAQGLEYLHQENIVHSDLKSMNVLVSANERAFLADFGIAKSVDTGTYKQTTELNGTLYWMAPELFTENESSSAHATKASDIFAFGLVCYEMFSGLTPFDGVVSIGFPPSYRGKRPPFPGDGTPAEARGLHPYIWEHIEECWAQDPNDRPSAEQAVQFYLGELDPRAPPDSRNVDVFNSPALIPTPENIAWSFMVW
ncbi:hypothetical protein HWV62_461 [Athelia sp. TMB]|nr:hypothetical protein HWV62_461 [Athelia sp. TMB]